MRKRVTGLNVGTNEKSLFPVLDVQYSTVLYIFLDCFDCFDLGSYVK